MTPDLPGFMRKTSVGNEHHQSPDTTHPRRRRRSILDIPYYTPHDSMMSIINNGEEDEEDEDNNDEIITSSFFIPGITGTARCLEGKSHFDAKITTTAQAGKVVQHHSTRTTRQRLLFLGSSGKDNKKVMINNMIPGAGQGGENDHNHTTYAGGLQSIHYEQLSHSMDYVRSLLLLQRSKDKKESRLQRYSHH